MRRLRPYLVLVPLALRQGIEEPNIKIDSVYFLERGFVSVVAIGSPASSIEIGLIGREGMTGVTVLLGDNRSPLSSYVQAPGLAYRIGTSDLRKVMTASAGMRALFLKYVQTFLMQTTHAAVANGRAGLVQRLARWLLMAHDRMGHDTFLLTHAFLSLMLGVRRAGVTEGLTTLEGEGLITASRGSITLRNRTGLEQRAANFYGGPEAEYRRLIG